MQKRAKDVRPGDEVVLKDKRTIFVTRNEAHDFSITLHGYISGEIRSSSVTFSSTQFVTLKTPSKLFLIYSKIKETLKCLFF